MPIRSEKITNDKFLLLYYDVMSNSRLHNHTFTHVCAHALSLSLKLICQLSAFRAAN